MIHPADTGNEIDNGLAVGALERIEERYRVTQQEPYSADMSGFDLFMNGWESTFHPIS